MLRKVGLITTKLIYYVYISSLIQEYLKRIKAPAEIKKRFKKEIRDITDPHALNIKFEELIADRISKLRKEDIKTLNFLKTIPNDFMALDTADNEPFNILFMKVGQDLIAKFNETVFTKEYKVVSAGNKTSKVISYVLKDSERAKILLRDVTKIGAFPLDCDFKTNQVLTSNNGNRGTLLRSEVMMPKNPGTVTVSAQIIGALLEDISVTFAHFPTDLEPHKITQFIALLGHFHALINSPDRLQRLSKTELPIIFEVTLPVSFDFRGRFYYTIPSSPQNVKQARPIFTPAVYNLSTLNEFDRTVWQAYIASVGGLKGDTLRSLSTKVPKVIQLEVSKKLSKSDDKNLILSIATYESQQPFQTLPIELDATASGVQLISILMNDTDLATASNVIDPDNTDSYLDKPRRDVYSIIRNYIVENCPLTTQPSD